VSNGQTMDAVLLGGDVAGLQDLGNGHGGGIGGGITDGEGNVTEPKGVRLHVGAARWWLVAPARVLTAACR
jgi:hypothetical protein